MVSMGYDAETKEGKIKMTGETHTVYTNEGVWEIRPGNPFEWEDGKEYQDAVQSSGYDLFTSMGFGECSLTSHRLRTGVSGKPEYMIEFNTGGGCTMVFTESFPGFMDVLAQWMPVVRDARIVEMLDNLSSYEESSEAKKYWTLGQLIRDSLR